MLVFIGHAGHPEVEGTLGQIDGEVHLVEDERDVEKLPIETGTPIAYITQTTLSVDDTRGVDRRAPSPLRRRRGPGRSRHLLRDAEPADRRA